MSDAANASIPLGIRQQFPCDDHGRVLWFTTPPLNDTPGPLEPVSAKDGKSLSHTPEYIAAREKRRNLIEEREKHVQERIAAAEAEQTDKNNDAHQTSKRRRIITTTQVDTLILQNLTDQILNVNKEWYKSLYGNRAAEVETFDALRAKERRKEIEDKEAYFEGRWRVEVERRERERGVEGRAFRDDWDGSR